MKINKLSILFIVTGVLVAGFYFSTTTMKTKSNIPKDILSDPSAKNTDVYSELTKRAQSQDKKILAIALEKSSHPDRIIREGAANALGYLQSKEALSALEKLLADREQNVRVRTLQAMGNAYSQEREDIILNHLQSENLSTREKTIGYSVLLKKSESTSVQEEAIDYLSSFAKEGDALEHYIAFSKFLEVAPRSSAAPLAKLKLKSKNPEMRELATRYLK